MSEPLAPLPEDYPELLADLAVHLQGLLAAEGLAAERARAVAFGCAEWLRGHWGGQALYLPKGVRYTLTQRNWELWRKFTGRNQAALAREYNLTERMVEIIIARCREEEMRLRQGSLL